MAKTMPKWATRLLALVVLATDYLMDHLNAIPETLMVGPVKVRSVVNMLFVAFAAIGLSGPSLWPQLAALLGNPGQPKTELPPVERPPAPPATAAMILLAAGLLLSSCRSADAATTIKNSPPSVVGSVPSANACLTSAYFTGLFDLSTLNTVATFNFPTVSGKLFRPTSTLRLEYLSVTGTPNVNGAYAIQQDGSAITGFGSTPVVINAATLAGFPPTAAAGVSVNENNNFPILDTSTHIFSVKITTAVGGISASSARWMITGCWQ